MKKFIKITVLIFTSLLVLGACHSKVTDKLKNTQARMTVSQLIKKAKAANKKVETVHFDMDLSTTSLGERKNQKMEADLDYGDQAGDVERANGFISTKQDGSEEYQAFKMPGGGDIYSRGSRDAPWSLKSIDGYNVDPDYFDFLDIVYSMKDDLKLKDDGTNYTLVLKSQNVDLVSLFEDELNMYLTGDSQSSMKKTFEVSFDKENFRLKSFKLKMVSKVRANRLSMKVESKYSKWNKISDSKFEAPDNVSDAITYDSNDDAGDTSDDSQEFSDLN
ncbi:DUF6612 family protein [Streptococcus tangpeifui]|uniref:DUF6612 family protein n=1 Tax=Streptococcus tangpeifui TaxID=2709400 RepID=UPI0013EC843A|nr:DUF6612 family protein [Streptococcus sp. ZJ373]